MNISKLTLHTVLILIIVITVSLAMSASSFLSYKLNKNRIIENTKIQSEQTINSLEKTIAKSIESYHINEYEVLISHEINYKNFYAIVVNNFLMDDILGTDRYISGKFRNDDGHISDYDPENSMIKRKLSESSVVVKSDIMSNSGEVLGNITIYGSDYAIKQKLDSIIHESLVNSIVMSIVVILVLFFTLQAIVVRPILDIVEKLLRTDERGLPVDKFATHGTREITFLSQALNHMVDETKQSQSMLDKANRQLLHSEKLSTVGKLAASIAHEFNNPLQGVMNVIGGVRERAGLSDKDAQLLDLASKECHRMRGLIRNLQQFNKPTSGQRSKVDVHQCIDDVLLLGKKEMQNKNISVISRYDEHGCEVWAIEDQVRQVLINIIRNAADSIDSDGTITITTSSNDEQIIVSIQDNGNGISRESIDHIFEPFYTTKAVKGTGLGLSVTYGIVKSHDGDIHVESEPGQGSTFTITLPKEMRKSDAGKDTDR